MKVTIPDKLAEVIEPKDITVDFTEFLIAKAGKEINLERKKIAALQKKFKTANSKQFCANYFKKKNHSFELDENLMTWDSAETIIKNRYREISQLRGFLNAYNKKHSFLNQRKS